MPIWLFQMMQETQAFHGFLFETKYKVFFRMIVLVCPKRERKKIWCETRWPPFDMGQIDQLILQQNRPVGVD